jgi:hypothetical protein
MLFGLLGPAWSISPLLVDWIQAFAPVQTGGSIVKSLDVDERHEHFEKQRQSINDLQDNIRNLASMSRVAPEGPGLPSTKSL